MAVSLRNENVSESLEIPEVFTLEQSLVNDTHP
jgi:hypothetical protein